eukprot:scaffold7908_cov69-Cylindrotheca_fusiformis.AAC.2
MVMGATAVVVRDILLSPDERFDVWNIKKEERPHLLSLDEEETNEEEEEEDHEERVMPLIDGCDIPGWRREHLISVSSEAKGILNVGSGCSMLRRESQLVTTTNDGSKWKILRKRLFLPPSPTKTAYRLSPDEVAKLTQPHPWFERDNVPVILEGCCTKEWSVMESCTWERLLKDYGDYDWRFSDTHGATMTMKTYTKYVNSIEGLTDDAPLAIYDSQLDMDERRSILDSYQVPPCFDGFDLFQDVVMNNPTKEVESGDSVNPPPYRWILIGPERSGTGLHIDPMGTHAWVTIVEGCKRWVLFPPTTKPVSIGMQDPQIPSSIWFSKWYPTVMPNHPNAVEVLQYPGETVYVPAGWPHLVLNLENTVAITQNYATEYPNLQQLFHSVEESEPEFFQEWLPRLKACRPDLCLPEQDEYCSCKEEKDGFDNDEKKE